MTYLTYEEYTKMGGTLDDTAFSSAERRARQLINAQAAGQTGKRIAALSELPQAVKDCTFDLISVLSVHFPYEKQVSSESQSQGGSGESVSYVVKTDEQIAAECEEIIYNTFYGGGIGNLLYWGACL